MPMAVSCTRTARRTDCATVRRQRVHSPDVWMWLRIPTHISVGLRVRSPRVMPIPWRLVAYGVAVLALVSALWGFGHLRFEAGRTAERDLWTPRLLEAQKAAADANARTLTVETAQKVAT